MSHQVPITDPFRVLGIDPAAEEELVRQRYLELVKQFPPERDPEKFGEIRDAYQMARDPVKRLEYRLYDDKSNSIEEILEVIEMLPPAINTQALLRLAESFHHSLPSDS